MNDGTSRAQGFGTEEEEEEEVSLRIEIFSKNSVSSLNPTPILPAVFTLLLGVKIVGNIGVGFTIDTDFKKNRFGGKPLLLLQYQNPVVAG